MLALSAVMAFSIAGCSSPTTNEVANKLKIGNTTTTSVDNSTSTDSAIDLLNDDKVKDKANEINRYIDNYFYFDKDSEKQEESYYDGIMNGLDDPYSCYYTKEEYEQLMEDDSGKYVGIGAQVTQDADMVISVVRPITGSPAEKAGIKAEDIIVQVDDLEITDEDLNFVVDRIRGKEGTTAYIKVFRPSDNKYYEFNIERQVVENVSVRFEMLEDKIAYIAIEEFNDLTADEFKKAVDDALSQNAKGIVFDVRDNPGGLVDSVAAICDYIMDEGPIVTIKNRSGKVISEYKSDSKQKVDLPMTVLVNGNSASAAEIFTGALKDTGMAKIVGTNTFGKGIVQSVFQLSDGSGIKVTIAKYFTPNGNDIHKKGIAPDYEVELKDGRKNAVNLPHDEDAQLKKALKILKKEIK